MRLERKRQELRQAKSRLPEDAERHALIQVEVDEAKAELV